MNIPETIKANFDRIIKGQNLTSKEIAQRLGISVVALSKYFKDSVKVSTLARLADVIGVNLSDLFMPIDAEPTNGTPNGIQTTCPICRGRIWASLTTSGAIRLEAPNK